MNTVIVVKHHRDVYPACLSMESRAGGAHHNNSVLTYYHTTPHFFPFLPAPCSETCRKTVHHASGFTESSHRSCKPRRSRCTHRRFLHGTIHTSQIPGDWDTDHDRMTLRARGHVRENQVKSLHVMHFACL
jgi:hypothetical protein